MVVERKKNLTVDQKTIAKLVASRLGLDIKTVESVVETEQKTTMSYIKRGFKVTKKNYLVLEPKLKKGYTFSSPIDGKVYDIPNKVRISVRLGEGFKSYVNDNSKMANRLCRFVEQK
jgi:nucleoid DNA-binding protein